MAKLQKNDPKDVVKLAKVIDRNDPGEWEFMHVDDKEFSVLAATDVLNRFDVFEKEE